MYEAARDAAIGWGRTNPTVSEVLDLTASEVPSALKSAGERGALARGLGRSYGDASQNGGGLLLRLRGGPGDVLLDEETATVTVGAGVSIDQLLRLIVPRGYFVPVTPGTRFVTIGGAVASDIHGKNHHVEGSFGNHVVRLTMLMADGSTRVIGPDVEPALFWATIGGMGLTGVIVDATFRLLRIESSRMRVDTNRLPDLDALFAAMTDDADDDFRYSVAWVDLVARGRNLGRSVLTRGDHARQDDLGPKEAAAPFAYGPHQLATFPPLVPSPGLVNRATIAAFNELWFRKSPRERIGEVQGIGAFFHPLDLVGSWNRVYGKRGMLQYQVIVPFGEEETLRTVVERLAGSSAASFLAVLKRFGAANQAPLSFPQPGWTLAYDVPAGLSGLGDLLHGLDRLVLDAGGRHYFAKDAHTTPEAIRRGYPRLAEWRAVRDAADPDGVWRSDLGRRLELID